MGCMLLEVNANRATARHSVDCQLVAPSLLESLHVIGV